MQFCMMSSMGVFEFHDLPAVGTDQMVVMRTLQKVGVVKPLPSAQGNFPKHPALHEMQDGAVDGGPGCGGVTPAQTLAELLGTEMFVRPEDQGRDSHALLGETQPLGRKESLRLT